MNVTVDNQKQLNPTIDLRKIMALFPQKLAYDLAKAKFINRGFCESEETRFVLVQMRKGKHLVRNYFHTTNQAMEKAGIDAVHAQGS